VAEVAVGLDTNTFTIEYRFVPSADAQERLDQAYALILDLLLPLLQNPEEDAAGAVPDASDAGGTLQTLRAERASQWEASRVG
jgi:hypothetical protein